MTVAAIILAAGASRRLGQPKQLLMHGGERMIERAIRVANEAGAAPVIAVLGAHYEMISTAVSLHNPGRAIPVINDHWELGIASSIHAGLRAVDLIAPQAAGVLMLGCDQPRLTAGQLRGLLDLFDAQASPAMVASAYARTLGIPAVFPRQVFAELDALSGDKGARILFAQPPCALLSMPFPGGEIDIDLPADLAQLDSSVLEKDQAAFRG
ncbi:MAG: nucleotidyltransferase family protein [Terracidiphilus sp.]